MPKTIFLFFVLLSSSLQGEIVEKQALPLMQKIKKMSTEVALAALNTNENGKTFNEIAQTSESFDNDGYPDTEVPYDLGTSDIQESELNKTNQPYDPNADYFNTNQGYDEYHL